MYLCLCGFQLCLQVGQLLATGLLLDGQSLQRIVHALQIAKHIGSQRDRVAELPDHGQAIFPREGIKGQFQRQTAIAADLCRLWGEHRLAHGQQRRARLLLVGMGDARQRKRREAVRVWVGILLDRGNIRAIPSESRLRFRDLLRKALADGVLQRVFLR